MSAILAKGRRARSPSQVIQAGLERGDHGEQPQFVPLEEIAKSPAPKLGLDQVEEFVLSFTNQHTGAEAQAHCGEARLGACLDERRRIPTFARELRPRTTEETRDLLMGGSIWNIHLSSSIHEALLRLWYSSPSSSSVTAREEAGTVGRERGCPLSLVLDPSPNPEV